MTKRVEFAKGSHQLGSGEAMVQKPHDLNWTLDSQVWAFLKHLNRYTNKQTMILRKAEVIISLQYNPNITPI